MTDNQLIQWGNKEYNNLQLEALDDYTHQSDFKAAMLAPALFLKSPKDFENVFDRIIYHLECAINKSSTVEDRDKIQHLAQLLFHTHVIIIQKKVEYIIQKNNEDLWTKLDHLLFGGGKAVVPTVPGLERVIVIEFGVETMNLISAYIKSLFAKIKLNKELDLFYLQMFRVFRKIISTNIYKQDLSLMIHTIKSHERQIFESIIKQGVIWDDAIQYIAFFESTTPDEYMARTKYFRNAYLDANNTDYSYDSTGSLGVLGEILFHSIFLFVLAVGLIFVTKVYTYFDDYIAISSVVIPIFVLYIFMLLFKPFKRSHLNKRIKQAKEKYKNILHH